MKYTFKIIIGLAGLFVLSAIILEVISFRSNRIASTLKREHISCYGQVDIISECVKKSPNAKVVLIGDSNAYHFSIGAKKNSPNKEIIVLTMGGCIPLARFTRLVQKNYFNNKCLAFNNRVDDILTHSLKKFVLL